MMAAKVVMISARLSTGGLLSSALVSRVGVPALVPGLVVSTCYRFCAHAAGLGFPGRQVSPKLDEARTGLVVESIQFYYTV